MERLTDFILKWRVFIFTLFFVGTVISGFLIPLVEVNMDIIQYFPEESVVRRGRHMMEDVFGDQDTGSLQLMFTGLSESRQQEIYEQLGQLDGVVEIEFDPTSPDHIQDGHSLFLLSIDAGFDSDQEEAFVENLNLLFSSERFEMRGNISGISLMPNMLLIAIPGVIILAFIFVFMSNSWFEPVIFFINIGIAVIINMGTNLIFGTVSDVTQMIAAILQVVLSMDYSIIFLNRYRQEKSLEPDPVNAMRCTIRNSFNVIAGISFTTIVGMLMLLFMSFTIGTDIGRVIAKGVFLSLLSVFGVMPTLILKFDRLIEATKKKSLHLNMNGVGKFSHKVRHVMLVVFILLFGISLSFQRHLEIVYSDAAYDPIRQVFERDNVLVLLYETIDEDIIGPWAETLEANENILEVLSAATTLSRPLNVHDMASEMDMEEEFIRLLYRDIFEYPTPEVTIPRFLDFLGSQDGLIPEETLLQLASIPQMLPPGMLGVPMNADELGEIFHLGAGETEQLLNLYGAHSDVAIKETLTLKEFLAHLLQREPTEALREAYEDLARAERNFHGEAFSRLFIRTDFEIESKETFSFIENVSRTLEMKTAGEFFIVGESAVAYEMGLSFPGEFSFISLLTAGAFFIVGALTFRSLSVSLILATVIQGAVYITFAIIALGGGINFLPLIIAQLLLKGRVIDYGILYTDNYIEARRSHSVKNAIIQALDRSIDTILTSGLIMILITFIVGLIFIPVNAAISEILLVIALGSFIGVMISIFILPSLIAVFDRFIKKNN